MRNQMEIVAMDFRRGERVKYWGFDGQAAAQIFGLVEAECNGRPGWFYVRQPCGTLDLIRWDLMERAP